MIATLDLARVKAHAGDPSAASLAEKAADEAAAVPSEAGILGWSDASNYADLGHLFEQLGNRDKAADWLGRSAAVWRAMKAPAALEPQRAAQLAAVEADLAKLR